ncbi:MAG: chemotaxis protein CheW [Chloroflexota bacterium]
MSYVLFGLGERVLALPLSAVEAVERPGRFTEIPFGAPWLRGVTAIRGAVVSVVDLGRFAGGTPAGLTPSARLLVTRAGSARVAFLVDCVGSIVQAHGEPQPAAGMTGPMNAWWRGVLPIDGRLVPVIDHARLMTSTEFSQYQLSLDSGVN